jgi:hypothetical protein
LVSTFGLGQRDKADAIEIQWPSGQTDKLTNVNAGETITVEEGKGITASRAFGTAAKKLVVNKVASASAKNRLLAR